jgi:hypothetical protein
MANKSTSRDTAIANRRQKAGEMYLRGRTQNEIALELRVGQPCISKDLAFLRKEWLQSALMDFNEAKSRELARIDVLEREAWEVYEKSKEEKIKRLAETRTGGKYGDMSRTQKIAEETHGDPRWLDKVQWCIEQRLRIFGIYDADKRETDWKEWLKLQGYDDAAIFNDMVRYFRAQQDAARVENQDAQGGQTSS